MPKKSPHPARLALKVRWGLFTYIQTHGHVIVFFETHFFHLITHPISLNHFFHLRVSEKLSSEKMMTIIILNKMNIIAAQRAIVNQRNEDGKLKKYFDFVRGEKLQISSYFMKKK